MALKRSFSIYDNRARACLKCGRAFPVEDVKDNTIIECSSCGQKMFSDVYGRTAVLTVCEKPDLRRRMETRTREKTEEELEKLEQENRELKRQLEEALQKAADWEEAADGLAHIIEQDRAKEGARRV